MGWGLYSALREEMQICEQMMQKYDREAVVTGTWRQRATRSELPDRS